MSKYDERSCRPRTGHLCHAFRREQTDIDVPECGIGLQASEQRGPTLATRETFFEHHYPRLPMEDRIERAPGVDIADSDDLA
jgi:hypothetical protein